jgi:AAA15 family ATPase/GTPase
LPLIQGDVGLERLVPLPLMGEGMTRLASIVLAIAEAQNGVVLIDEIENGFYHSLLVKVWQLVAEAGRLFNTQVFATTHSLECIQAASKAYEKSQAHDFRLHRLEPAQKNVRAVTYDKKELLAALDAGLEVR